MSRPKLWRVRVRQTVESYVEVRADSANQAEIQAAVIPGVVSVFGRSAIQVFDDTEMPEQENLNVREDEW